MSCTRSWSVLISEWRIEEGGDTGSPTIDASRGSAVVRREEGDVLVCGAARSPQGMIGNESVGSQPQ